MLIYHRNIPCDTPLHPAPSCCCFTLCLFVCLCIRKSTSYLLLYSNEIVVQEYLQLNFMYICMYSWQKNAALEPFRQSQVLFCLNFVALVPLGVCCTCSRFYFIFCHGFNFLEFQSFGALTLKKRLHEYVCTNFSLPNVKSGDHMSFRDTL